MKNSTKGSFNFRAITPIINILPKKKKNQQLPKESFHSGSRKGNKRSRKGITRKIKFSLEKIVTIQSPTLPSLVRSVIYMALLCRKLSGQLKEGAEGGKRKRHRHRKERREKKKMAQRLSPDCRQGDFPGRNPGAERLPQGRR